MFSISGMVHFKSKALERTILKIWLVLVQIRTGIRHDAYLLHVDAVAGATEDEAGLHGFCEALCLCSVSGAPPSINFDEHT
jgi:hypothetical protein